MEGLTVDRGRRAIENLLALLPKKALIRVNGGFEELAIDRLRVDQIVNIRPAEEIPVDGIVILGHSTVDHSSITSESKPVEKIVGSTAFAGTTLLGAIGRAAQGGAIVQGGRSMEALGTIDTIILDKTGTLTCSRCRHLPGSRSVNGLGAAWRRSQLTGENGWWQLPYRYPQVSRLVDYRPQNATLRQEFHRRAGLLSGRASW